MHEPHGTQLLPSDVRARLDDIVIGIELTLISLIQGIVLFVLADYAREPIINLQFQYWPYIAVSLVAILIFWSRSLIHTLSFIGWPLELGHNFIYFALTLIEGIMFTQVAQPIAFYALGAAYFLGAAILYWYDERVMHRHLADARTPAARALYVDIIRDQRVNVRLWMPLGVLFSALAAFAVWRWPQFFIDDHWHVALALGGLVIATVYLFDGIRILRQRQPLIVSRFISDEGSAAVAELEREEPVNLSLDDLQHDATARSQPQP